MSAFVTDFEVLHGAKPEMQGKRVHDVPGIDGPRFVNDIRAAHKAGGAWVDYDIINPTSGQVQGKASWVEPLDAKTVVGCGIYRSQDTSRAAPAIPAVAGPAAAAAAALGHAQASAKASVNAGVSASVNGSMNASMNASSKAITSANKQPASSVR